MGVAPLLPLWAATQPEPLRPGFKPAAAALAAAVFAVWDQRKATVGQWPSAIVGMAEWAWPAWSLGTGCNCEAVSQEAMLAV